MTSEGQKLAAAIAAIESQRELLGEAVAEASIASLRAKLAALSDVTPKELEPTLKQVSILFLDAVGSTALSQRLDPEEISAVMDGALSRCTAIVQRHGGRVLQYAGDSLLAVFGTPESREDDAERAVRCGLALLSLGRTLEREVQASHAHSGFGFRVGINTGGVMLGGGVDAEGTIRGIAVNVAARMEQTAPTGGLRISRDTYTHVRGLFDVEEQAPMRLKGIDEPIRTYLVLRARPQDFDTTTRGIEGLSTRMVGRDAEITQLQEVFAQMAKPAAGLRFVMLVGDPGLGKSRLLHEFRSWTAGRAVAPINIAGRATPSTQSQPFGLLRHVLAVLLRIRESDSMSLARRKLERSVVGLLMTQEGLPQAEAHAHLIGQLIGLDFSASPHVSAIVDQARQIRDRAFRAAVQALRCIHARGAGRPLLVLLEDLHWADDGSLDFLQYLVQTCTDLPLLLIATARPTLFERRGTLVGPGQLCIELRPLDAGAGLELTDDILRKLPQIPAGLRELINERAEGNPFYIEELVNMLTEQVALQGSATGMPGGGPSEGLKVPPTLVDVLQARLDGLPSAERYSMQLASVIGVDFLDRELAYVEPGADTQLPPLLNRRLILSAGAVSDARAYAFQHQILRDVTYATLVKQRRMNAHARVAQWLAGQTGALAMASASTIAEHYELAGDKTNAREYYARAAEQAAAAYENDLALRHTARALASTPDGDHEMRWRLLANRERVLDRLSLRAEQMADIDALTFLADVMDDDCRRADAAWRRCDLAMYQGDFSTQERYAAEARSLAERAGAHELGLRALQRMAVATAYLGKPGEGEQLARRGMEQARVAGSLSSQARFANALSVCSQLKGDRVAALAHSQLALRAARDAGDTDLESIAIGNVATGYLYFGACTEARAYGDAVFEMARTVGNQVGQAISHIYLGVIDLLDGDGVQALLHAKAALDMCANSPWHTCNALTKLGEAELAMGNLDAAAEAFQRAISLGDSCDAFAHVLNALAGLARASLARGDAVQAAQVAEQLLARAALKPGHPGESDPRFAGADKHRIRLTLYEVWVAAGDSRAHAALVDAHAALVAEAAAITDEALRTSFLRRIPCNAEIEACWAGRAPQ